MSDIQDVIFGKHLVVSRGNVGHKPSRYLESVHTVSESETDRFFQLAPFAAAPTTIRHIAKTYVSHGTQELQAVISVPIQRWWQHTLVSEELETAIRNSRSILEIAADPDEGVLKGYEETTWNRTIRLLRQISDGYYQETGFHLAAPAISAASKGSIDMFWERPKVTLLVNVPEDQLQDVTFYGRRLEGSRLSGSIHASDENTAHLVSWLGGRQGL